MAAPAQPEIEPTIRDCSNDDFGTDAPFTEEQLAWIASTLYKPGLPFANRIEADHAHDSDAQDSDADSDMSEGDDDDEEEDKADAEAETAQPEVANPHPSIEPVTAAEPVTEIDYNNLLSLDDFPDLNDELFGDAGDVNFGDFVNDE